MSEDKNKPKEQNIVSQEQMELTELEKAHPEIKKLNPSEKQAVLRIVQSFSGPIPPPTIFAEYAKIDKSFPERIMKMAEKEQEHRHFINTFIANLARRGQYLAALLSTFLAWIGYRAIVMGYPKCALIIFGITIGALLTAYLKQEKEDKPK